MTPSRGEARLKQALQGILDTASIANDPSPQYLDPFTEAKEAAAAAGIFSPRATKATVTASKGRPFEQEDLWRRLRTFKSLTWFCKPAAAAPVECARRGWTNTGSDLLTCEWCASKVSFSLPPGLSHEETQKVAKRFAADLAGKHTDTCPWRNVACSPDLVAFPIQKASVVESDFKQRCGSFDILDRLPPISREALSKLAARRDQLETLLNQRSQSLLAATSADAEGVTKEPNCDGSAARAPRQSLTDSSESTTLSSLTLNPAAANSAEFQCIQQVLALLGWSVVPIPGTTRAPKAVVADDATNLHTPQRSSGRLPKICGSQAVMFCRICGAKHGLWSFVGSGPSVMNCASPMTRSLEVLGKGTQQRVSQSSFTPRQKEGAANASRPSSSKSLLGKRVGHRGKAGMATIAGGSFQSQNDALHTPGSRRQVGRGPTPAPAAAPFGSSATRLPAFNSGPPSPAPDSTPSSTTTSAVGSPPCDTVSSDTAAGGLTASPTTAKELSPKRPLPFGYHSASVPAFGIAAIRHNIPTLEPSTPPPTLLNIASRKRSRSQEDSPTGVTDERAKQRPRLSSGASPGAPAGGSPKQMSQGLDPLQLHRPYCPWIAHYKTADGKECCGWVTSLNALSPVESATCTSLIDSCDDTESDKDVRRDRFAGLMSLLRNGWTGHT